MRQSYFFRLYDWLYVVLLELPLTMEKQKRSGKTGPRCIGQDHGDSAEGHDPETSRQKRYGKYDLNILLYIVFNE